MGPLTLLPLLGFALGVSRVARVPAAVAFFLATALVILSLYAGALVGALWWTALAVHAAGVVLLAFEALGYVRRERAVPNLLPLGILAVLCAWFWVVHGEDLYFVYDEYAHWGIFLKDMLARDDLWTGATNALHPRYPPAAPLWQYLFNVFGSPSEGKTYFAHFVLLLAPVLMLWNTLRWSQPVWVIAILALVLFAIANFGLGVSTIYVDQIIGVWYLGTLLAAFSDDKLDLRRLVLYAAPLTVVALLKDVGLALAASGALIIAALSHRRNLASGQPGSALLRTGAGLAVLLVPMLLCVQLWSWNRDAAGAAHDVQSVGGFVSGVTERAGIANPERDAELARRLAEVFFDQQLSNSPATWKFNEFTYEVRGLLTAPHRLTTFGLLVAFVLWWVVIARGVLAREERPQWTIVAGGVLTTALAYIAALHFSYRFTFGDRGLDLPSYLRYVHIVALPMLLLSFCPLLPAFRDLDLHRAWRVGRLHVQQRTVLFVPAVLALYVTETPYLRRITQPNPPIGAPPHVEDMVEQIRGQVGTSRVWIYYPQDSSHSPLTRFVLFLLAPTPAVVERSDRFFRVKDTGSIAGVWSVFDYVWIASPLTPEAAAGFARFDTGNATAGLFRVHVSTSGSVTLEPVVEQDEID